MDVLDCKTAKMDVMPGYYCIIGGSANISSGSTCPSGYYEEEPDGTYFTYTSTSVGGSTGTCYKVTGCNNHSDYFEDIPGSLFRYTSEVAGTVRCYRVTGCLNGLHVFHSGSETVDYNERPVCPSEYAYHNSGCFSGTRYVFNITANLTSRKMSCTFDRFNSTYDFTETEPIALEIKKIKADGVWLNGYYELTCNSSDVSLSNVQYEDFEMLIRKYGGSVRSSTFTNMGGAIIDGKCYGVKINFQ